MVGGKVGNYLTSIHLGGGNLLIYADKFTAVITECPHSFYYDPLGARGMVRKLLNYLRSFKDYN